MSVMGLNAVSFTKNIQGISSFSHVYNYGRAMYTDDITPTFRHLQAMNAKSYYNAYKHHEGVTADYVPFKKTTNEKHNNLSSLLKSLQCLYYNIELDKKDMSFDEAQSIKFLKDHIDSIKSYLIDQLTDYKEAQWG